MENKITEMICIVCPKGCHLAVNEEDGLRVSGFGCPRGEEYGKKEMTNPTRVLTSIVRIKGAIHPCCPVKTNGEIPKGMIQGAMELLKDVTLPAPVQIGDVAVSNICGTDVCWVVTKNMNVN